MKYTVRAVLLHRKRFVISAGGHLLLQKNRTHYGWRAKLILEYVGRLDDLFLPSTLLHGKLTPGLALGLGLHCTVQDAVKLWTLKRVTSDLLGCTGYS